ncbi:14818_t:CDS:1, partial [Cetraspora pellucida]
MKYILKLAKTTIFKVTTIAKVIIRAITTIMTDERTTNVKALMDGTTNVKAITTVQNYYKLKKNYLNEK